MTPPINSVSDSELLELAKAFHDGPLMADDHEFVTDSGQAQWCLEVAKFFATELAARRAANTPVDGVEPGDVDVDFDGEPCATEGCGNRPASYFEAGGIGSYYCKSCLDKIRALPTHEAQEPVAGRPTYADISVMVHAFRERQKQSGEGDQMLSRWISEGLDALYPAPSASREVTARIRAILDHPSGSPEHDLGAIRAALLAALPEREG